MAEGVVGRRSFMGRYPDVLRRGRARFERQPEREYTDFLPVSWGEDEGGRFDLAGGILGSLGRGTYDLLAGSSTGGFYTPEGEFSGEAIEVAPIGAGINVVARGLMGARPDPSVLSASMGPTYRSRLDPALERVQEKGTKEQARSVIAKTEGGVSADELDFTGVEKLLEGEGPVTRAELRAQAEANPLEIVDVVKGADPLTPTEMARVRELGEIERANSSFGNRGLPEAEFAEYQDLLSRIDTAAKGGTPTKFGPDSHPSMSLPGGENYRETLLTLPLSGKRFTALPESMGVAFNDNMRYFYLSRPDKRSPYHLRVGGHNLQEITGKTEQEVIDRTLDILNNPSKKQGGGPDVFTGGHYDEPNVLAHYRSNERVIDGDNTLFIEEIQSDWHQRARRLRKEEIKKVMEAHGVSREEASKLVPEDFGYARSKAAPTDDEVREFFDLVEGANPADYRAEMMAHPRFQSRGVPDAPFKKNWPDLALRRAMRDAAERDMDRIAWTPGAVQADRYDLSKHIDRIKVTPRTHAATGERTRSASVTGKDGTTIEIGIDGDGVVDNVIGIHGPQEMVGKPLDEVVGKEMAEKIMAAEGHADFTGLDLKVGGEGMKAFYDKHLVNAANKFGKKYGVKVETKQIQSGVAPSDGELVWSGLPEHYGSEGVEDFYQRLVAQHPDADLVLSRVADNRFTIAPREKMGMKEVWSLPLTPEMKRDLLRGVALSGAGILGLGAVATPDDL